MCQPRVGRMPYRLVTVLGLVCAGAPAVLATPPPFIPAGEDCWQTPCGTTSQSFCETPIPPGFFEPGSAPFNGVINLGGPPGSNVDTQVRRLSDMTLPGPGDSVQIPIEIVQLDLVSCEPIMVVSSRHPTGSPWNVQVDLSHVVPQQPGTMTVTKTHQNGGTFTSELPVRARFIFTNIANPSQVCILDTGQVGMPPLLLYGQGNWVHTPDPDAVPYFCGQNFVPGVVEPQQGQYAGEQCCTLTCHPGATASHCVLVPVCSPCPWGACCFPGKGDCSVGKSLGSTGRLSAPGCLPANGQCKVVKGTPMFSAREVCERRGGVYGGDGTTCHDLDGDGIPNFAETHDCCASRTRCRTGTNPTAADSDGDGFTDGAEMAAGTNPCDPASHPAP